MKDSNIRNRPYVYLRADDVGLKMTDGKSPKYIALTPGDIVRAKKANSKQCAFARASLKLPGVLAAYFFRSVAFLEYCSKGDRQFRPKRHHGRWRVSPGASDAVRFTESEKQG